MLFRIPTRKPDSLPAGGDFFWLKVGQEKKIIERGSGYTIKLCCFFTTGASLFCPAFQIGVLPNHHLKRLSTSLYFFVGFFFDPPGPFLLYTSMTTTLLEQLFWIALTCILTPVSSILCCIFGLWFQRVLKLTPPEL